MIFSSKAAGGCWYTAVSAGGNNKPQVASIVARHTAVSAGGIYKPQVANYAGIICTLLYRRWINLAAGGWPQ